MSSTAQVHAAISALYGSDASQQKSANDFLVAFAATGQAWETSLQLVGTSDPSVQYFGANMLYGKVKSDWSTLPEAHRAEFVSAVSQQVQTLASKPESVLAARRMCLVMAGAATRLGPDATTALVQQALDLAGVTGAGGPSVVGVTLALEIQAAVAEEVNDADRTSRSTLVNLLIPRLVEVLGLSEHVLEAASAPAGCPPGMGNLRAAALHAALAWLRLDERGGGGMVLSPGQLAASRGGLMRGAMAALAAGDTAVSDAAAEFVVAVLQPGAPGLNQAEENAALAGIVGSLLMHREAAADLEEGEDLARAVSRVAVAVAERDVCSLTNPGAPPENLALTDLVLGLAEAHERPVMEAAADYFLMLNTVPVADRHPQLREPLFTRLVAACLRRATLPSDFTTWDAAEEDRDTFTRFREQILADVLDNCYGMMRSRYLAQVGGALSGAATWQAAEAAVFATRAVAAPVKQHVLAEARAAHAGAMGGGGGGDAAAAADRAESSAFLAQLFARVGAAGAAAANGGAGGAGAVGGVFVSHPLVMESTARMVGQYAAWLGQTPSGTPCVQGSVAYLLAALRVSEAFRHASQGLRNVCARCAAELQAPELLTRLMESVEACMPSAPPPSNHPGSSGGFSGTSDGDDDRAAVVEGLARVVASLPPARAVEAGKTLAAPIVARAATHAAAVTQSSGAQVPPSDSPPVALLAAELRLLASAVRFLEFSALAVPGVGAGGGGGGEHHPAMAVLSAAWPTLSQLNRPPWNALPAVTDALCEVYTRALLCAKHAAGPLLPHVLEAVRETFAAHHHPACLDVLAVAVEVFASGSTQAAGPLVSTTARGTVSHIADQNVAEALASTLLSMSQSAHACLSAAPIADHADCARATFECAQKFALFAPAIIVASPALPPVMQIATAALSTMERDAVRAAVALLSTLVNPGEKAAAAEVWQQGGKAVVEAYMSAHGEALIRTALTAGADTCPRHLLRPVAQLLHAMQTAYPQPVNAWILSVVGSPQFPTGAEPVGEAERRLFCELVMRNPPLPPQRWSAMVVDFFQICRKEASADALIAHQM